MPERARIEQLSIRSDPGVIREARRWLARIVGGAGWSRRESHDLALALSEACSNAHRYAYDCRKDGRIDLSVTLWPRRIEILVRDYGCGFDLAAYRVPDLAVPREGGYGIFLMNRLTDHLEYRPTEAGTLVVMTKLKRDAGEDGEFDRPAGSDDRMRNVG